MFFNARLTFQAGIRCNLTNTWVPHGTRLHPVGMAILQICVDTKSNKSLNCNLSSN